MLKILKLHTRTKGRGRYVCPNVSYMIEVFVLHSVDGGTKIRYDSSLIIKGDGP